MKALALYGILFINDEDISSLKKRRFCGHACNTLKQSFLVNQD